MQNENATIESPTVAADPPPPVIAPAASPPAPAAPPAEATAASPPPADWQPHHPACTGVALGDFFKNHHTASCVVDPFNQRPGERIVLHPMVSVPAADKKPIIDAAQARVEKVELASLFEIKASDEYLAWQVATGELTDAKSMAVEIAARIERDDAELEALARTAPEDKYKQAAADALARRDRLQRLSSQRAELAQKIPQLESALLAKTRAILTRTANETRVSIMPILDSIGGLLEIPEVQRALDVFLENQQLDERLEMLRTPTAGPMMLARLIGKVIVDSSIPAFAPSPQFVAIRDGKPVAG